LTYLAAIPWRHLKDNPLVGPIGNLLIILGVNFKENRLFTPFDILAVNSKENRLVTPIDKSQRQIIGTINRNLRRPTGAVAIPNDSLLITPMNIFLSYLVLILKTIL
jgi:hypothetical protein